MNAGLTSEQKQVLEAELKRLIAELEQQRLNSPEGGDRIAAAREWAQQEPGDAFQSDADREVALARADRNIQATGQLTKALARVHQPEVGLCSRCGEAIAWERLRLEPWVTTCIDCASQQEQRSGFVRHSI